MAAAITARRRRKRLAVLLTLMATLRDHGPCSCLPRASAPPVVISGAGPCGLLCAVVLKKYNVPFVIVEKVEESRLTADVGSGFDMAPTAISIFRRLQLPRWQERMSKYAGITMMGMDGQHVRVLKTAALPGGEAYGCKRSSLQLILREALGDDGNWSLHCGASVVGYAEEVLPDGFLQSKDAAAGGVAVKLSDGTTLQGRALLACEGWRSATRTQMLGGSGSGAGPDADPVNFCGVAMWWGRCELTPRLTELLRHTQTEGSGGDSFCWFMGSSRTPGNFVGAPTEDGGAFMWSAAQRCDFEPAKSDDLTIRGGMRGQAVKSELEALMLDRCELIRGIVAATPAASVTKVGLYDRQNLDQRMVSAKGRVALLGDAAHPQTPFLGQGCNMALADAFAVCTRLGCANRESGGTSDDGVRAALSSLDAPERRAFAKKTVTDARWIAELSVTDSSVKCFLMRQMFRFAPARFVFPRVDEGNQEFVDQALRDCGLPLIS